MLIRVRGGRDGIKDYLERGQKDGREFDRDELDERVMLSGDLALTDTVINDMQNEGERYLHITLAFREDQIDRQTLQAITDEFREFALSAYQAEEYNFYAEAHLPRIKSYTNKQTGQEVERKPHIHIVIPKQNMLSGTMLDPLYRPVFDKSAGRLMVPEAQLQWLEAFQESVNAKYGLASPKDHPRLEYTDESTIIARYKGDIFKGERAELKDRILSAVLDRGITSFEDFRAVVAEHGEARTRRAGQEGEYMNVKPEGAAKGTNLKEHVFSREFIELPTDEKRRQLAAEARKQYVEAGPPRPSPAEIEQRLQHWHAVRARELKYLNPGSRKAYAAYQAADPEQRLAILKDREAAFYARHREDQDHDHRGTRAGDHHRDRQPDASRATREPPPQARNRLRGLSELDVVRIDGRSEVLLPRDVPRDVEHQGAERDQGLRRDVRRVGRDDSVVGQLVRDQAEQGAQKAAEREEFARIKAELDARRLLAHLSRTHGVTPDKYQVEKAQDGTDRIRAGTRRLNVSDFLTKELHLPWKEAAPILREAHAAQLGQEREPLPRRAADRQLWQEFKRWQPTQREQRAAEWQAQRDSEKARRAELRRQHQAEVRKVRNDRQLKPEAREAALRSLAALREARSRALVETFEAERQAFKARQAPGEQYRVYLQERSQAGDVAALAELRRQRDRAPVEPSTRYIEDKPESARPEPPAGLLRELSYRVDREGVVTYYDQKARAVLRDTGQRVGVEQEERAAIEAGLRLAVEKFGTTLKINGTDDFKRAVVEIAVRKGMGIEFSDPAMNQQARDYAEALKLGREFIRKPPAGEGDQVRAEREARELQERMQREAQQRQDKAEQEKRRDKDKGHDRG